VGDFDGLLLNKLPDGMELDLDMFDGGVASLILSEVGGSIVIAVQGGRLLREETDPIQELTQPRCLVGGLVQGDVLHITGAIHHDVLFLQAPGNHPRAKGETVPADRAASVNAVCVI